jgi:RNA polymerase sigma factor, sigma-70 family
LTYKSTLTKHHLSKLADEELLINYQQSEELNYLGEVYQRYVPLVYGLCIKYLNNKEEAQDAVMDIYELVAKKINRHEVKNFKSWLYTVSKNHCLYCIKQNKRENWVDFEDAFMENEDNFTLFDVAQDEENMKALEYCMQQLSEEQRISIEYFYMQEQSYADIVGKTGYALSKVKSYIQNGKRNLKTCIINIIKKEELS